MCRTCGFISYPGRYKTKEEIKEYYKKEYRSPPSVNSLYTGERKLHYHAAFLKDLFTEWRKAGRNNINVVDVGSAFGLFLKWARDMLPGASVSGVELTTSFVRNAWDLYKIRTVDEFDDSQKYDLISSYKSLEHILDPDIELRRYITSLKDDGYLYIAVPVWFETLKNFGLQGFDIEYYYSPNHINTWTRKHFEGLIKACGGEVVKFNESYYEVTYLVKRNDALIQQDRSHCYEKPQEILDKLEKVYQAAEANMSGDYARVIELWPNCPHAWTTHYEMNRKKLHEMGFDYIYNEICLRAISACNCDADLHYFAADICARYDQYEKAIQHLTEALDLRPAMPNALVLLMNCFASLGKGAKDEAARVKFYQQAKRCAQMLFDTCTQHKGEAMTWIMYYNSLLPTPWEKEAS